MDHQITVEPTGDRIEIFWRGRKILDTTRALELRETTYPPVIYAPREDADMSVFERSTCETRCPYKGTANYFSLVDGAERENDAVWTYETPIAGVAEIEARLAFYRNKVEIRRTPA